MQITITIDDVDAKALSTITPDIAAYAANALHQRARRAADAICEDACGAGELHTLTEAEKTKLSEHLASQGIVVASVKNLTEATKRRIVDAATITTAAARVAAEEL